MRGVPRVVPRVVFDTSTLVSAALRPGAIPWQALALAMRFCEVCASRETLDELREVLSRDKFERYLAQGEREKFVRAIESAVRVFILRDSEGGSLVPPCRDAKDDKFLALALEAEADTIVSGDEDLLVLDPWNSVRIASAAGFIESMGESI